MTDTTPFPAAKQLEPTASAQLFDDWFDPIEVGIRARVRGFIQELIEAELEEALSRGRYVRRGKSGQISTETTSDTTAGATSTPAKPQLPKNGRRKMSWNFNLVNALVKAQLAPNAATAVQMLNDSDLEQSATPEQAVARIRELCVA